MTFQLKYLDDEEDEDLEEKEPQDEDQSDEENDDSDEGRDALRAPFPFDLHRFRNCAPNGFGYCTALND